jgi:hypothetical protein
MGKQPGTLQGCFAVAQLAPVGNRLSHTLVIDRIAFFM